MVIHNKFESLTTGFCSLQNSQTDRYLKTEQVQVPGQFVVYSVDEEIL